MIDEKLKVISVYKGIVTWNKGTLNNKPVLGFEIVTGDTQKRLFYRDEIQKIYEYLGRFLEETKDPYYFLKLEREEINKKIAENHELQQKYPDQITGLRITCTTLEQMKEMLEEQIGDN